MMYDFKTKLAEGEQAERQLDEFFCNQFQIEQVDREAQRNGIDRIFITGTGRRIPVEYKTDWTASKTGNAFVETVSVDTANKPGWAYTSKAEYLVYYLPDDRLIYIIQLAKLRGQVDAWQRKFKSRAVHNDGYNTVGVLVPLDVFEKLAVQVVSC